MASNEYKASRFALNSFEENKWTTVKTTTKPEDFSDASGFVFLELPSTSSGLIRSSVTSTTDVVTEDLFSDDVPPEILMSSGNHSFSSLLSPEEQQFFSELEKNAEIKRTSTPKRKAKCCKRCSHLSTPVQTKLKVTTPKVKSPKATTPKVKTPTLTPPTVITPTLTPPAVITLKDKILFEKKKKRLQAAVKRYEIEKSKTMDVSIEISPSDLLKSRLQSCPGISLVLKGVVANLEVCILGDRMKVDTSLFIKMLLAMGAEVKKRLTKTVTHLVFKDGDKKKYWRAKNLGVAIVGPLWVHDCLWECKRLPEVEHPITLKEKYDEYEPPLMSQKQRKRFGLTNEEVFAMIQEDREKNASNHVELLNFC